jgi:hypothetical protein
VFGGDPSVLGRLMSVNNVDVEIIGVLPRGFGGLEIHQGIDVFTPFDAVIRPAPPAANWRSFSSAV